MSYPPYQGGYPNPPNSGGSFGFQQQQEFGGQSMYPQAGLGFPMPPSTPASANSQNLPYSMYPTAPSNNVSSQQTQSNYSAPYPPQPGPNLSPFTSSGPSSAPYPPAGGNPTPFNTSGGNSAPYPPAGMNTSPYPPSGGVSAPYPPTGSPSAPYSPNAGPGSAPFPPSTGAGPAPYPLSGGAGPAPYPPNAGAGPAPYPPNAGAGPSPYPPNAGAGPAPYPPSGPNISPYGSSNLNSSPSNVYGSPYPPSTAPTSNNPYQASSAPPAHNPYSAAPTNSIYPVASLHSASVYGSSGTSPSSHCTGCITPYQERPTVRPGTSFDPSSDSAILRKAMKGFGTDEAAIIQVLGRRTSHQRQEIKQKYQQSFGRDLVKDLNSEISGQFSVTVMTLMMPLPIYLARELNHAISGVGTNEKVLIEILCTNDNNMIRNIKVEYQKLYRKPLETDLRSDTSGDFGRLMVAMAAGARDETGLDASLAPKLAKSLYDAGVKKRGTNESEFNRILSSYSYPLLRLVFQEYVKVSGGKSFESSIKSELSGDFRNGILALYESINNRAMFYARCLRDAMKGMGTNEKALIRIIVSRCEIDMGNIKDEYRKAFGKRLEDSVASETSGDYKKMLLALIQG